MCDNQKKKKKDTKSYFLTSSDPDMPLGQNLHHCILLFITFDLICNMTMFVQDGFWTLQGRTPLALPHRGYIKIPNVFLQSSSIGLSPVKFSRF